MTFIRLENSLLFLVCRAFLKIWMDVKFCWTLFLNYMSIPLTLQQITTRFSGLKQHNLLSYSVMEVGSPNCVLQAPNQCVYRAMFLCNHEGRICSLSFLCSRGHPISLATAPFSVFKASSIESPNLSSLWPLLLSSHLLLFMFIFLPPASMDLCDCIGPPRQSGIDVHTSRSSLNHICEVTSAMSGDIFTGYRD